MAPYSDAFRRLGHPATRGRGQILRVLAESPVPLLPRQIRAAIPDPKPDLSTVYRTLAFLSSAGLARAVDLGGRGRRYEACRDEGHTHRAVCRRCGRIEPFRPVRCDLTRLESAVRRRLGFHVADHALEFFGTCARCRGEKP